MRHQSKSLKRTARFLKKPHAITFTGWLSSNREEVIRDCSVDCGTLEEQQCISQVGWVIAA